MQTARVKEGEREVQEEEGEEEEEEEEEEEIIISFSPNLLMYSRQRVCHSRQTGFAIRKRSEATSTQRRYSHTGVN